MRLKALIVDDDHNGRKAISILLKKHYYYLFAQIDTANSIDDARDKVNKSNYNLCFLNIQPGSQSGFELLPFLFSETRVIFFTPYSEIAIKAIKERAFDYILKPIDVVEFKACISRLEKEYAGGKEIKRYLLIKEQGETIPIPIVDIEYLEADGAYSKIYLITKEKYTTAKTLKALSNNLGDHFIRIHKSYMVNIEYVKSFKKDILTTSQNNNLPVSRVGSKELSRYF